MKKQNNQLLKLWFLQATETLCHLSVIKKLFCNVWFFCINEACVNCGKENATTLTWLLKGDLYHKMTLGLTLYLVSLQMTHRDWHAMNINRLNTWQAWLCNLLLHQLVKVLTNKFFYYTWVCWSHWATENIYYTPIFFITTH